MPLIAEEDFSATPLDCTTEQTLVEDVRVTEYGSVRVEVLVDFDGETADLELRSYSAAEEGGTYKRLFIAGAHASNEGFRTYKKNGHVFESAEVGAGDQWLTFVLLASGADYIKLTAYAGVAVLIKAAKVYGGHA